MYAVIGRAVQDAGTRTFFEVHAQTDGVWTLWFRTQNASQDSWKQAVTVSHVLPPPIRIVQVTQTREVVECATIR
jgi:hypothetical protein